MTYNNKSLTIQCKICKQIISGPVWYLKNMKYCSNICVGIRNKGQNNPAKRLEVRKKISKKVGIWSRKVWKTKKYKLKQILSHLGKFKRNKSHFKKGHIPWNLELNHKIDNRIIAGNKHHWWRNYTISYYCGKNWKKQRLKALKRDNYKCKYCNSNKNLHIHHKIPYRKSFNNSLKNLVTLCNICHKKEE